MIFVMTSILFPFEDESRVLKSEGKETCKWSSPYLYKEFGVSWYLTPYPKMPFLFPFVEKRCYLLGVKFSPIHSTVLFLIPNTVEVQKRLITNAG